MLLNSDLPICDYDTMVNRIKAGIFVFNEVEVMDFAGPFEVFSLTKDENDKLFEVIIIGK